MIALLPAAIDTRLANVVAEDRLRIPQDLADDLASRSAEGYPHEVCGLLLGRHYGGSWRVEALTQGRNLVEDRREDRFELDPAHYLEADRIAARAGLDIIGVWHTHPDHPAVPSATDRHFAWEGFVYVIVPTRSTGTTATAGEPRAWVFDGRRFSEIEKETT